MNLVPLYEEAIQFNNFNGTVLAAGKVEVWYLGRTRKADIYADVAGETPLPNPFDLNNLGMQEVYVNPAFNYTLVVYDAYGSELFAVDKYLQGAGGHTTSNIVVQPSEHIGVSAWTVGEVQIYQPYLVGEVGKTYEGIDPIVVNNTLNRISANHIPLGVQDPLYFVEDSESACILGCSAQTEIPSALSSKWDEASDAVIANSAQWAEGAGYEAGSYISIDNNTINVTGLQPEGDYAYNSALSSKLDVTALPQDLVHSGDLTAYQPAGNYLSATDSANFYPIDNPSGFITGVDLTDYATTAQLDEKLDKTDSGNFYPMEGNPSGFLTAHQSLDDYATKQWVEDKGYITGIEESATWNATTETVSSNSATWGSATPQIPVTGINGIKISESADKVVFEVSGDYYTNDNPSGFITGVPADMATTGDIADLAQSISETYQPIGDYQTAGNYQTAGDYYSASNPSGFITGVDLTPYQTVEGMTAYQPVGEYYSASNPSGFITGVDLSDYATTAQLADKQDITGMTAYQPVGDYLTTADSANFYTTANESGFITGVDLTPYQTVEGMTAYQEAGDYYSASNPSGFLTAHQSLEGYLQDSDLELNSYNKISAISGLQIAGGGGSVELDYDPDGNISGIEGSALSDSRAGTPLYVEAPLFTGQSGNSAYIGSDFNTTVLWTGTGTTTGGTINLSESLTHFERYGLYYYIPYQESNQTYYQELVYKPGQTVFGIITHGINSSLWRQYMDWGTMTDTSINLVSGRQGGFWMTGSDRAFGLYDGNERHHYFTKIIGVNRIR